MFEITKNKINLVIDDKVLGYILYDEKTEKLYGNYVYVNPEERGKGYANLLIERFVELSKEKNKKIVPICPVIKKIIEYKYEEVL